jgi:hypothetical protein
MKRIAKWLMIVSASSSAWGKTSETTVLGFKAFEVFSLKAENGSEIKIGEGQLTPRPTPIPKGDWQAMAKALGMKGDRKHCKPSESMTPMERFDKTALRLDIQLLADRVSRQDPTRSPKDKTLITSIPNCKEFADVISYLGDALGLTSDTLTFGEPFEMDKETLSGTMVSGISFANEGHGWLIVNNRLSTGQTAIAHLGVKYRDFESLLLNSEQDIEFKYTKQPVALRFKRGKIDRKVTEGHQSRRTCSKVVYVQECTYDPVTKKGKCQQVPYDVEGSETNRTDYVEESITHQIQYRTPDFSKVLGVIELVTKTSYEDDRSGLCEVQEPNPQPPRPF